MSAAVKYAVKTRETGVSIRLEETVAGRTHMDVGAGGFSLNRIAERIIGNIA